MPVEPIAGARPVLFDDVAAARLAADLDALADALATLAGRTAEDAPQAAQDWIGFTRTWFERRLASDLTELRRAAAAARRGAEEVRRARSIAGALQEHRNAEALRIQHQYDLLAAAATSAD